jgi:phosphate:Na+ symporter
VTAAIASVGGAVPARRTALSFILLNLFSGALAFVMLPLWLGAFAWLAAHTGIGPASMIALFHTGINLAGVAVLLPLTDRYAALITRLIPEQAPALTRNLDTTVLSMPSVAIESARRTVVEIGAALVAATRSVLASGNHRRYLPATLETAGAAAAAARSFLGRIRSSPEDEDEYDRHLGVLHAADHLDRLLEALHDPPSAATIGSDATLREVARAAGEGLVGAFAWLDSGGSVEAPELEALSRQVAERRRLHRPTVLARTAGGEIDPDAGLRILDAMRWVDRAVYHVWRATYHLSPTRLPGNGSHEVFEDAPTADSAGVR